MAARRGHRLRPRQQRLLDVTLPRLAFAPQQAADPLAAFRPRPAELWLEVGFGGGEHALAQIAAHPEVGPDRLRGVRERHLLAAVAPGAGGRRGDRAAARQPAPVDRRRADAAARCCRMAASTGCSCCSPTRGRRRATPSGASCIPALLPLLARVLKPGAEWRVASDDPTYQAWVTEVMAAQSLFDAPPPATERPGGLAADPLRGEGAARGPRAALLDVHPALTAASATPRP